MSATVQVVLAGLLVLSASIWVGGLVTIAVVARAASGTLTAADRVAFFRALGRSYGIVGGCALVVALGTGAGLLAGRQWDAALIVAAAVAAALVVVTAVGVLQARRMTRLRQTALDGRDPELARRVYRGARRAAVLRGCIALLTLALVAVAAILVTQ